MKELIDSIIQKHRDNGIDVNPPASHSEINKFEKLIGFTLPQDFKDFYLTCNGFACNEDLFKMRSLVDISQHPQDHGDNWFDFSEYMICSDTWGLRLTSTGQYEIFNGDHPVKALTSSLTEFLEIFLKGNVFDSGGLYEWQEELEIR
jgi:cell wall assembly regulator SMI1